MKIVLLILAVLICVVLVAAIVGACLPRSHEATRSAVFHRPPAELYTAVRDFAALPAWRHDLRGTELLPPRDGRACYREFSRHGAITYLVMEDKPAEKLILKIADENLPFGGTWTFEFSSPGAGLGGVRITENGEVKNPLFRFMARFVFGYAGSMENYLRDLGRKSGETVAIEP